MSTIINGLCGITQTISDTTSKFYTVMGCENITKLIPILPKNTGYVNADKVIDAFKPLKDFLQGTRIITTAGLYIGIDSKQKSHKLYFQLPRKNGALDYSMILYTVAQLCDASEFLKRACNLNVTAPFIGYAEQLGILKIFQNNAICTKIINNSPYDLKDVCVVLASTIRAYSAISQFISKCITHAKADATKIDNKELVTLRDIVDFSFTMMKSAGKIILITCRAYDRTNIYFYVIVATNLAMAGSTAMKKKN